MSVIRNSARCGLALLGALCAFTAAIASNSAAKSPTLFELPFGLNPVIDLAPDGSALAYAKGPAMGEETTLWVRTLPNGGVVQLLGAMSFDEATPSARSMMRPRWSPDGSMLAYLSDEAGEVHLNVWWRESKAHRRYASRAACKFSCVQYDLQWSPDGRAVYYLAINEAVRAEAPHLYTNGRNWLTEHRKRLLEDPDNGGVTVRSFPAPKEEGRPTKALNDVVVAFVESGQVATVLTGADVNKIFLSPNGRHLLAIATGGEESQVRQSYQDFYVLELPNAGSGETRSEANRVLDWRGKEVKPSLPRVKQFYVGQAAWSPDSKFIAYAEQGALADGDVFVFDVSRKSARNLTAKLQLPAQAAERTVSDPEKVAGRSYAYPGKFGRVYEPPLWSRDGKRLFTLRTDDNGDVLWEIKVTNGEARRLTDDKDFSIQGFVRRGGVIAPNHAGEVVVAVKFKDEDAGFIAVRPDGQRRTLLKHGALANYFAGASLTSAAERVPVMAFVSEKADVPPEAFTLDLRTTQVVQVTDINRDYAGSDPGEIRPITWTRPDGGVRHATLHLPPRAARVKGRLPVIMTVYPLDEARKATPHEFRHRPDKYIAPLHDLLHRGYAILEPNIAIKAGGGACVDVGQEVVRALDAAAATGTVDADRAGIIGFSFGGWTVNCVITQTNRFKAAVSGAGLANMFSAAFTPEQGMWALGGGQVNIDASLWDAPELYIAESPVLFSPKVTTPLLLVHGKDDDVVDARQSVEMFEGLSRLGKTVTLALYDGRDHSSLVQHPDYLRRVSEWFERYLAQPE